MKKIFKIIGTLRDTVESKYEIKVWEYEVVKETEKSIVVLNPFGEEKRFFTKTLFDMNPNSHSIAHIDVSIFSTEDDLDKSIEQVKEKITEIFIRHQKYIENMSKMHTEGPTILRKKVNEF